MLTHFKPESHKEPNKTEFRSLATQQEIFKKRKNMLSEPGDGGTRL